MSWRLREEELKTCPCGSNIYKIVEVVFERIYGGVCDRTFVFDDRICTGCGKSDKLSHVWNADAPLNWRDYHSSMPR